MPKIYSHPSNARRAARAALGKNAKEGVDYRLSRQEGVEGVGFEQLKAPAGQGRAAKRKWPATHGKALRIRKPAPVDRSPKRKPPAKRRAAKTAPGEWRDQLQALLERPQGVTAAEVAAKFGWEQHTSRARISTGLRERGIKVERRREQRGADMVSVYRALPQLQLGEAREKLGNVYVREAA